MAETMHSYALLPQGNGGLACCGAVITQLCVCKEHITVSVHHTIVPWLNSSLKTIVLTHWGLSHAFVVVILSTSRAT